MAATVEEPFASVRELRAVWPDMPTDADENAETLLLDASQFLVDLYEREVDTSSPATLRRIVCSMVRRIMQVPDELIGFSQFQQGAGPYQGGGSVANPHGDFYLTAQEKKSLGVGQSRAFEIDLLDGSRRAHENYVQELKEYRP